jgi:hypothetical protein
VRVLAFVFAGVGLGLLAFIGHVYAAQSAGEQITSPESAEVLYGAAGGLAGLVIAALVAASRPSGDRPGSPPTGE